MKTLAAIRKAVDTLAIKHAAALQHAEAEAVGITTAQTEYRDALEARRIGQELAKKTQIEAVRPITQVVNRCLDSVFPDTYSLKVNFELRRGKTEIDLLLCKGGMELDPMGAVGGGVLDVASLGIRLAVLMLTVPRVQRVLILDEPLKNLQAPRIPRMRMLLQQLSSEFGTQIIQTTPVDSLQLGQIIRIGDE